jgi:hypothetical protein
MGINYYRRGWTLNIAYSCGITIINSIDSTNNRHHMAGLPDYIINIVGTMPPISQNNFETSGKSGCYLQSDFSFPDIYHTSEKIRSLPKPLDRFKNIRPISPVVYLGDAAEKQESSFMIKTLVPNMTLVKYLPMAHWKRQMRITKP